MKRTAWLQETRMLRFEEALDAWTEKRLTQEEAARLLGVCARRSGATWTVTVFKNGREMAAWLGLVPRQRSTGGRTTDSASTQPWQTLPH